MIRLLLRSLPISRKLMLVLVLITGAGLLVALIINSTYEFWSYQRRPGDGSTSWRSPLRCTRRRRSCSETARPRPRHWRCSGSTAPCSRPACTTRRARYLRSTDAPTTPRIAPSRQPLPAGRAARRRRRGLLGDPDAGGRPHSGRRHFAGNRHHRSGLEADVGRPAVADRRHRADDGGGARDCARAGVGAEADHHDSDHCTRRGCRRGHPRPELFAPGRQDQ